MQRSVEKNKTRDRLSQREIIDHPWLKDSNVQDILSVYYISCTILMLFFILLVFGKVLC